MVWKIKSRFDKASGNLPLKAARPRYHVHALYVHTLEGFWWMYCVSTTDRVVCSVCRSQSHWACMRYAREESFQWPSPKLIRERKAFFTSFQKRSHEVLLHGQQFDGFLEKRPVSKMSNSLRRWFIKTEAFLVPKTLVESLRPYGWPVIILTNEKLTVSYSLWNFWTYRVTSKKFLESNELTTFYSVVANHHNIVRFL